MSVNGITNSFQSTPKQGTTDTKSKTVQTGDESIASPTSPYNSGVVYEKTSTPNKKNYTANTNLINQLKADADQRFAQLQNLVTDMLHGQGKTFHTAYDLMKSIQSGSVTVDKRTISQAQADVGENGYWGVKQTSERILSFAKALTGGDPSMIDKMEKAVEKGFKSAKKDWGGDMPSITDQTYAAVKEGFKAWREETD